MLLQKHIESILGKPLLGITLLGGGDISRVYKVETDKEAYVCKLNHGDSILDMFKAEARGLKLLEETGSVSVPDVIDCGVHEGISFLLMEFIQRKSADDNDMRLLGEQLAELHSREAVQCGLDTDNFIGSLAQENSPMDTWPMFFAEKRLYSQIKLARKNGFLDKKDSPGLSSLRKGCQDHLPPCRPVLLHGDLWNGNYLISVNGRPYLIDPAVYYGHAEVDIAMTRLFGGFRDSFYEAYYAHHPKSSGYEERMDIYQLYYLLVHLNIFGTSYKSQVTRLFTRYFPL